MCNQACIDFGQVNLQKEDVCGKTVIEIRAMDVNGSLRPHVESLGPSRYIGVDIEAGPGVDIICDAERLLAVFGAGRVIFGTDSRHAAEGYRHWLLSGQRSILDALQVSEQEQRKVLGGNMARLVKLPW